MRKHLNTVSEEDDKEEGVGQDASKDVERNPTEMRRLRLEVFHKNTEFVSPFSHKAKAINNRTILD